MNSNIEIIEGKTESDLQQFYQLYLMGRKKLTLPPQPYAFIKALWDVFGPKKYISLLLARKNGQNIAGLFLFKFRDRVSAEFAVYDDRFLNVSPLHLLFWEAIQSAYSEGYRIFDFGRTSPYNQSLMDFKGRWGTTVVDLHHFYYPADSGNNISKRNQTISYKIISKICRIAPSPVFQKLGNFLYQHMS